MYSNKEKDILEREIYSETKIKTRWSDPVDERVSNGHWKNNSLGVREKCRTTTGSEGGTLKQSNWRYGDRNKKRKERYMNKK